MCMYRYICHGHPSPGTPKTNMESKNGGFFHDFLFQGDNFQVFRGFVMGLISSHPFEKGLCECVRVCVCVCLYIYIDISYIYIHIYIYINHRYIYIFICRIDLNICIYIYHVYQIDMHMYIYIHQYQVLSQLVYQMETAGVERSLHMSHSKNRWSQAKWKTLEANN